MHELQYSRTPWFSRNCLWISVMLSLPVALEFWWIVFSTTGLWISLAVEFTELTLPVSSLEELPLSPEKISKLVITKLYWIVGLPYD